MTNETSARESELGDASQALARYREHLQTIANERDQLKAKDRKFGVVRVILFFAAIVCWIVGIYEDGPGWIGTGAIVLFLIVVIVNEPIRERLEELRKHRSVIRRLIARLERDWDRLATKQLARQLAEVPLPDHRRDVADDLDLLGRASLFHLVSMSFTMPGIRTLAGWLAGPAVAEVARERSTAIAALAPMREERLRFYTLSREVGDSSGDPDQFTDWAIGEAWLPGRKWLVTWSHVTTGLSALLVVAFVVGIIGIVPTFVLKYSLIAMGALIAINMLITTAFLAPAHAIFSIAMHNRRAVDNYEEIFSAAGWIPQASDGPLTRIRDTLLNGPTSAVEGMRALRKVAGAGGLRQSAATFLIYLPLQALMLWDVRVLKRLEDWQEIYREHVGGWFSALGELEALLSLAALRDEYPGWAQPSWQTGDDSIVLEATSIGHPLLHDGARVCNDVSMGPPGTMLLVTGSNMSGKSTMLRSVGLNVALAGAGAPVCAKTFQLPSVELATSIRVSDNLSEGVSFYMAELKRLKSVVQHAQEMSKAEDRVCLFLLDEILQGTNSRERQIAVVQVLGHLMQSNAIGAISTHDLELADEPELQSIATAVHFRETIRPDADGNEQMTFDYKMHQGVSPTTNALRLLEIVGLGQDDTGQTEE